MTTQIRLNAFALLLAAGALLPAAPASARGGAAANIMNSEGYQRALREERQRYQQAQPQQFAPVGTTKLRHRKQQ